MASKVLQITDDDFIHKGLFILINLSIQHSFIMDLTTILFVLSLPFVLLTVYFGTKNDFYESENYKGDGCAHDVKR